MSKKWNTKALPMWEGWSKWRKGSPVYDTWLNDYKEELERHRDSVILELGSGVGADTRYLLEREFRVLSTDYSREALLNIKKYIPGSETKYVDMNGPLPFEDGSFWVVIGDISLHYFDREMAMTRKEAYYSHPKMLYEIKVEKR